jgi:hypothetical protein
LYGPCPFLPILGMWVCRFYTYALITLKLRPDFWRRNIFRVTTHCFEYMHPEDS